jgi:hypothetical protein
MAKKLYGAAAKAHAKKARKRGKKRASPKRARAKSAIVVRATSNPKRGRRRSRSRSMVHVAGNPHKIRRRRRNPGSSSMVLGKGTNVTSVKTWEKVGMMAVEAVAGGIGGGMAATALEARLAQPPTTVGIAEIALGAVGILAGYKLGYPAVGLGFGAVAGSMGAKNIYAAHSAPPATTAPAAAGAAAPPPAAAAQPPMGALTMGALLDDGTDISGYEGIAAVQDASGTDDRGRSTYADVDDYQDADAYSGSSFED